MHIKSTITVIIAHGLVYKLWHRSSFSKVPNNQTLQGLGYFRPRFNFLTTNTIFCLITVLNIPLIFKIIGIHDINLQKKTGSLLDSSTNKYSKSDFGKRSLCANSKNSVYPMLKALICWLISAASPFSANIFHWGISGTQKLFRMELDYFFLH